MTKRFFTLIAVLAISLLAACSQTTSRVTCKSCPVGIEDCCGACPCGAPVVESSEGKLCDPALKKKHHRKHRAAAAKVESGKPVIPFLAPAKKEAAPKAKATPKAEPAAKQVDVFEGVKKIIKDVSPKDPKEINKTK